MKTKDTEKNIFEQFDKLMDLYNNKKLSKSTYIKNCVMLHKKLMSVIPNKER